MIDGKRIHGGLSDRFWGILSTYKYCKDNDVDFKINFVSPYKLETFLLPNKIDWRINPKDISYNPQQAHPRYVSAFSIDRKRVEKYQNKVFASELPQLHVYSNTKAFNDNEFHTLFYELFKLSPLVNDAVKDNIEKIGEEFVSVTFRFQQLLGDFIEGNFPIIQNDDDRERLIKKCLQIIENLRDKEKMKILVTSDSTTFLKEASKLENIVVIPGKVVHVDYNQQESEQVHLKSFIDLFMIAKAKKVYLANPKPLYHSGFPKTSALIGNKPYFEIED